MGTSLLEALTKNGIQIPSPCGGKATCKQCKVQVILGGEEALEVEKSTFTSEQIQEGWKLSCQNKVKRALHISLEPYLLNVEEVEAEVISNQNVATFIKELIVKVPKPISYRSGAYMQIHVPPFHTNTSEWKENMNQKYWQDWEQFDLFGREIDFSHLDQEAVIRAYSMASYPAEGQKMMFNIRIATPPFAKEELVSGIPWGICSSYLFSLCSGDRIRMSGPYGESFMKEGSRELIFLIGGAGSSFSRSHILHLLKTEKSLRSISLWYGARSLKENIYQEEYEKLEKEVENFSYHLVLSEPLEEDIAAGWRRDDPVKTNFLFRAFEEGKLKRMEEPEEALYYVCGPPLHNKSVLALLDDYGVQPENIVLDDFGS